MARRRAALTLLAVALPFAVAGWAGAAAEPERVVFRFADPDIIESSGLVLDGDHFVTTNDSGDRGRVFTVTARGETIGVTSWASAPQDVEALAPGGDGQVWVGDIGDNRARRDHVTILRVPVGPGTLEVEPASYDLSYPGGARDAEALLTDPRTGRVYLASKVVFGGELYAVPADLEAGRVNRVEAVGAIAGLVTDGAFFPDGRHLILRSYTDAYVYAWPSLDQVAQLDLPAQRQGEGIAVGAGDRIYLSSEGARAPVLELELPARVVTAMEASAASARATPTRTATPAPTVTPSRRPVGAAEAGEPTERDATQWWLGTLLFVGALVVGAFALRPKHRRGA